MSILATRPAAPDTDHYHALPAAPAAVPARIQRLRTKGWRAPKGTVCVGRGSAWGNPWRVGDTSGWTTLPGGWTDRRPHGPLTAEQAVASYRNAQTHDIGRLLLIREQLAGRTLMCWCRVGAVCHGDWLLELANGTTPLETLVDRSAKPDFPEA
ncbi:DUF4326 domain-containing protein [Kitasatospora sp. NPDC088548]|uniref:DUF4326 domain-containing protein n=1 Tax=Kitasatospora sp. NPDC088548 TaxID=3364075 RepID=UPI003818FC3E